MQTMGCRQYISELYIMYIGHIQVFSNTCMYSNAWSLGACNIMNPQKPGTLIGAIKLVRLTREL